ncbi:pyruvate dehydrogenase E2 component (dihydrolipoamide acetyltransferase) [Austwickia chelonae]|uniref:Dihydrolipoamide acetyltransferase component of pyruvate dehydrogenase complex n=1 Tax=Austwickia chelonae NBRC 105200 TaxID=1184607 RepID=K6W9C5_9MICO|nr:dihydrolipoamide acetyltransferase family protein [Austwickia chelonae]GAB78452.1 putative dihydrolipoamide acyltransferase [Austwickia chelonae NBRC 105200]SEW39698.1 pyruvate dehydrogenase E2 component (dihydrolipoamide acetyltransferase) [Austwickia chelonae]
MTTKTFVLPDLGEGLTEAEIVSWAVAVGDEVAVDQVIATVETAKAQVELPCPFAGVVSSLHGEAGSVLDVGAPFVSVEVEAPGRTAERLAEERGGSGNVLIGYGTSEAQRGRRRRVPAGGGRGSGMSPGQAAHAASQRDFAFDAVPDDASSLPGSRPGEAVRVISPLVRKLAAEHGVDLRRVRPSAPGGIITKRDVECAVAAGTAGSPPAVTCTPALDGSPNGVGAAPPGAGGARGVSVGSSRPRLVDERIPITGVRKVIADKLDRSRREIPDATTWVDVDATGLRAVKDDLSRCLPQARIGYLALLARIVVAGLTRFPELNARVDSAAGEIVRVGAVHLSFAAQGPRGLVVPVVRHADSMTTEELAAALRGLVERAREGVLTPEEMSGGTFTLNNYGVYGVDGSTPIINHPEAGMLGVGRIVDKPWVVDGALAVRPVTQLSLSFDHRVCDGGVAGGFLRYVADCVECPGALLAGV